MLHSQYEREMDVLTWVQQRVTKEMGGLEHLLYKERLEELGMHNLKKTKLPTRFAKYQNSAGHSSWQPFLALGEGLDQMNCRGVSWPQPAHNSGTWTAAFSIFWNHSLALPLNQDTQTHFQTLLHSCRRNSRDRENSNAPILYAIKVYLFRLRRQLCLKCFQPTVFFHYLA